MAALLALSKSIISFAPPVAALQHSNDAEAGSAPDATQRALPAWALRSDLTRSERPDAPDEINDKANAARTSTGTKAPSYTLESLRWTKLHWLRNKTMMAEAIRVQEAFWRDPDGFLPRPVVYRPLLPGMGWGNFVYNIVYHVAFANYFGRPLLMSFVEKDPTSALGWNASEPSSFFMANYIDWRPRRPLEAYLPKNRTFKVTCRIGSAFGNKCGGSDGGNFDKVLGDLRAMDDFVLYSEYSASFIAPFERSSVLAKWAERNVVPAGKAVERPSDRFPYLMRYTFNLVFKLDPGFFYQSVAPHLNRLGAGFVTSHVRAGPGEMGQGPRTGTVDEDESRLRECRAVVSSRPWLMLTDDSALATRLRDVTYTTVDESFSMKAMHVGHFHMITHAQHRVAWKQALTDWMLIVCAPGPVLLRSRVPSAFSFGERSAILAGLDCSNKVTHNAIEAALVHCAGRFFDKICVRRDD